MPTDYHQDDPISVRPDPVDLQWLEHYAALHGMSRHSAFKQALATFRLTGQGWQADELLDVLAVVVEALDIPYAACEGDAEIERRIRGERTMILLTSLKSLLDRGPDHGDPRWTCMYIRKELARHPATGYRTDYDQVMADSHGITIEEYRARKAALDQADDDLVAVVTEAGQ